MKNITIIGLGNMGSAIARSLESLDINITTCEINDNPNEKLANADAFIIAVKPQSFNELASSINIDLSEKLAISIMAGVSIENIQEELSIKKVVRSMPNLGIQIGKGVVGWIASEEVGISEKDFVKKMFQAMGTEVELEKEEMIDAITAISGSGPAYFFYLCQLLQKKAEEFGFNSEDARKIAQETFVGSATLLESGDKTAREWRKSVTSKGGTTQAALEYMMENGFEEIFKNAIEEAKEKSEKLNI